MPDALCQCLAFFLPARGIDSTTLTTGFRWQSANLPFEI
jgi:hypothetical protein